MKNLFLLLLLVPVLCFGQTETNNSIYFDGVDCKSSAEVGL